MFKTRLQEILNKLKESDPTLILYSTSSDTDTTIWLDQPEEISTFSFTQLREFFYGVFPQHKGGRVYSQLRIGHTIPTQEFCQDISWWAKAEDVRLDRKPLQYIKTANIGFFLFSHEYMHVLKLEEELNAEYSAHTMDDTAVLALSFRPVWDGVNSFTKKGKSSPRDKQSVRAICIECKEECKRSTVSFLENQYSADQKSFPLGYRMRFIKAFKDCINIREHKKCSNAGLFKASS